ncbi:MAG: glycosyltransferase [Anaerolineaceae bacterium]|nr:glycosyltransferase [Anaerolineaceae bacterium]
MQPLVSIVTPSRNQARFLEDTMKSVISQDYPRIEYLVIDGNSSDGSRKIIQKYQKELTYWVSEPDQGQTDAINKGFSHASGDILAWLNSDDAYLPGTVTRAVDYLNTHPEVGMVYGDALYIDECGRVIGKFPARQTNYNRLRQGFVHIPQQSAFFRTALWKQVGPLDPGFYFAMDYDLWVRISRISTIAYHPETWSLFRLHPDAKTIEADNRCWPEMIRVHRRDGGSWVSLIMAKYMLRRFLAPVINYRRRRMISKAARDSK